MKINPTTIIEGVSAIVKDAKEVTKTVQAVIPKDPPKVDVGVIQAYIGIKPQKLFQSMEEISKSLKGKFQAIKSDLPEAVSTKFEKAIAENDFSFSKIFSE